MTHTRLFASVLALLLISACDGPRSARGSDLVAEPASDQAAEPTDALAADLQFLREEEKLARDVYLTLHQQWRLQPHANIASSEQTHMDRAAAMLTSLEIADPVEDDSVGVFVNDQLRQLYAKLVEIGTQSDIASLHVGATIEDLDLRDIELMKSRTTHAGVLATYEALQCGSRNHLRAFTSQLARRGVSYSPQYLTRAEYDGILASPHERCGR